MVRSVPPLRGAVNGIAAAREAHASVLPLTSSFDGSQGASPKPTVQPFTDGVPGRSTVLEEGRRYKLGRSPSCDIRVGGRCISRTHLEFEVDGGRVLVRDRNSTHGTYIGDQRVRERWLGTHTVLSLPGCEVVVRAPGADTSPTADDLSARRVHALARGLGAYEDALREVFIRHDESFESVPAHVIQDEVARHVDVSRRAARRRLKDLAEEKGAPPTARRGSARLQWLAERLMQDARQSTGSWSSG